MWPMCNTRLIWFLMNSTGPQCNNNKTMMFSFKVTNVYIISKQIVNKKLQETRSRTVVTKGTVTKDTVTTASYDSFIFSQIRYRII